jgi:hypothetical protein
MTWKVKACYWENNQLTLDGAEKVLNQPGNPVLYNRWSETQELNDCLFTTKTREGKFVIRSDNSEGFIVDKFRDRMAILGVPPGWLRTSSTYKVDPSGLGLEYRHTDVEQFKMPPVPAYKANGNYTESTLRYGAQRWGEIHLRLDGSKNTSQSEMMQVAMGICSAKLRANGVQVDQLGLGGPGAEQNKKIGILEYMHVKTGMYENFVEITMRARLKQSKVLNGAKNNNPAKVWGYDPDAFTFTPGSEELRDTSAMYPSRGTAGVNGNSLLLQAAAYYDPSLRNTRIDPKTGQLNAPNQLEVGQAGQKLEP